MVFDEDGGVRIEGPGAEGVEMGTTLFLVLGEARKYHFSGSTSRTSSKFFTVQIFLRASSLSRIASFSKYLQLGLTEIGSDREGNPSTLARLNVGLANPVHIIGISTRHPPEAA